MRVCVCVCARVELKKTLISEWQMPEDVEAELQKKMSNQTQFMQDIQAKMAERVAEARQGVFDGHVAHDCAQLPYAEKCSGHAGLVLSLVLVADSIHRAEEPSAVGLVLDLFGVSRPSFLSLTIPAQELESSSLTL